MSALYFVIIVIFIAIYAFAAKLMSNVAIMKGYGEEIHAWAICFWLGIFGYLYILALPDKIIQSQNQQIIKLLNEQKKD